MTADRTSDRKNRPKLPQLLFIVSRYLLSKEMNRLSCVDLPEPPQKGKSKGGPRACFSAQERLSLEGKGKQTSPVEEKKKQTSYNLVKLFAYQSNSKEKHSKTHHKSVVVAQHMCLLAQGHHAIKVRDDEDGSRQPHQWADQHASPQGIVKDVLTHQEGQFQQQRVGSEKQK